MLKSMDGESDEVYINTPPGFSDESSGSELTVRRSGRQNKNKGPSRYGNPVKHSIKLISSQQQIKNLNKAVLEAYRMKLATFRTDVSEPVETKLGLLENTCLDGSSGVKLWIFQEPGTHRGGYRCTLRKTQEASKRIKRKPRNKKTRRKEKPKTW